MRTLSRLGCWLAALLVAACGQAPDENQLVIYTARAEHLIQPLLLRYTEETGTPVRFVTDKAGPLLARLAAEGEATQADVLITVDAGNLWQAARQGLLQAIDSPALRANVPAHLRDPEGRWYGLSLRARAIVYATDRVDPAQLDTYAGLADPRWRGRLCLRTSKEVYNQSLVATLIANRGEREAEAMVRGWVANLAAPPFASDTQVIEAIAAGQCDLGLVNTYYLGRLQRERPDLPVALFWPDQAAGEQGAHVNVSGAGVTRHSPRPAAARAFIEWLSAGEAQQLFASLNLEYPVNPEVAPDPLVAGWGEFRADDINLAAAGEYQAAAVRLMDRAGYQ
ncbi:MAG: extracellular solute-binding protein [Pseudomonadota bacterium]